MYKLIRKQSADTCGTTNKTPLFNKTWCCMYKLNRKQLVSAKVKACGTTSTTLVGAVTYVWACRRRWSPSLTSNLLRTLTAPESHTHPSCHTKGHRLFPQHVTAQALETGNNMYPNCRTDGHTLFPRNVTAQALEITRIQVFIHISIFYL